MLEQTLSFALLSYPFSFIQNLGKLNHPDVYVIVKGHALQSKTQHRAGPAL